MGTDNLLGIFLVAALLLPGCGSDPGGGDTLGDVTLNYTASDADGSSLGDGGRGAEDMKVPGEVSSPPDGVVLPPDLSPDLTGEPDLPVRPRRYLLPGDSTDPTECCSCDPDAGCEGCLVGASSCMEACQGAGMSYGWCAEPGSKDPSACCACQ